MATKKTVKKVDTPIDERETFVSLQKSFADSDLSVAEKLKVLYELQAADNEIGKLVQLRGELPAEVAVIEGEIAALNAKIAKITEAVKGEEASIEINKEQITVHEADIEKYKAQLANISNSREYDSISKELENENLLLRIADKSINEAKERIADDKKQIEEIEERISVREDDLAAKREELDAIVNSTADEEKTYTDRRNALAAKLDARTMSAYERIKASTHNHLAVVPVYREEACGGCFNTITPQRLVDIASGSKLVICEHCGRIIVNPEI
jgi:hypothetical protein